VSSQATVSPSMMQERERSQESASAISGKRRVRSLPGRLHSRAVFAGNNPKAIMLSLVQPIAAGGQLIGFSREAWRDEPGREGTLQHVHQLKLANHNCNFYRVRARVLLPSAWS
jgi:hypothetical protein